MRTIPTLALLGVFAACSSGASEPASMPAPAATPAPAAAEPAAAMPAAPVAAYTTEQAARGQIVFSETCSACHATSEFSGEDFMFDWEGSSVGRLYRVVSRTMPDDQPGSLPQEQYLDVVAYMLQLNNMPAGREELTADRERMDAITIGN